LHQSLPKPKRTSDFKRKDYSTVSNAFSKSRSNRIPGIFSSSALSIRSNDPTISGIKFNNSEYLESQYADDTSLTLEDDPVSLKRCLQIFDKFGDCAEPFV
jgi:hypothetical protein